MVLGTDAYRMVLILIHLILEGAGGGGLLGTDRE